MKALRILILVAIVLAIAVPAGVSAQDKQQVTMWFHSGQGGERDALDAQITAFNEMSDEYEVVPVEVPEGNYNDQVKAAALAGELPCVLDFDGPFIYNYVFSGDLIPLDMYASEELLADVLPSIIEQGTVDGQLWSLGRVCFKKVHRVACGVGLLLSPRPPFPARGERGNKRAVKSLSV